MSCHILRIDESRTSCCRTRQLWTKFPEIRRLQLSTVNMDHSIARNATNRTDGRRIYEDILDWNVVKSRLSNVPYVRYAPNTRVVYLAIFVIGIQPTVPSKITIIRSHSFV